MKAEQIRQCAERLVQFHGRFAPLFYEKRQSACSDRMLHGLLLDGVRANAAELARATPGADVRALQHFVGLSSWNHRPIIREAQAVVAEELGHPEAVLVCDESGFPKKGQKSVGVARQYSGTLGKVDNCQVGVFLAYVSEKGQTLVDEQLYLPKEWARDKDRRKEAGVPEDLHFQTKPEIALGMIREAAEGPLPFRWVACDDLYGQSGNFRDGLEHLRLNFVAEVPCKTKVWTERPPLRAPQASERGRPRTQWSLSAEADAPTRVDRLVGQAQQWHYVQARQGRKKPIGAWWAALRVYPWREGLPGPERWLLIEQVSKAEHKYYLSNGGPETSLEQMAQVAKKEWFVEQCFREAKDEIGLDEFEVRRWRGWHHHMTMCILAHVFLATLRQQWKKGALS